LKKHDDLIRQQKDLIPKGCDWVQNKVDGFDPENNFVVLNDNKKVLILSKLLQLNRNS
jgi:hypothetical protein